MVTLIHWPWTIGLAVMVWVILVLVKRYVRAVRWPKAVRPIDVAVFAIWWSLASITFQLTHFSILLPLLLMYTIWGVVMITLQTFVWENFVPGRFLLVWWRLVDLVSVLVWLVTIIYVYYGR